MLFMLEMEDDGEDYCAQNKFRNILVIIDECYSATNMNRPGIKRLIKLIESDIVENLVVTDHVD